MRENVKVGRNFDAMRNAMQDLRKGKQLAYTGAAYEAYGAAKERFRAVKGDAVLAIEEEPKLEFETLWFTTVPHFFWKIQPRSGGPME